MFTILFITALAIMVRYGLMLGVTTMGSFGAVLEDVSLTDDDDVILGDGSDAKLRWSTGDADNNTLVIALGDDNQALHITDVGAIATDWNVSADTHPTLYIHSNTTPATDYMQIGAHNATSALINVASGNLLFKIAGTTEMTLDTASLTLKEAFNVVLGTSTGTKIGTATTQKLGFFNATPIVQPSAYTQTYSTADKTHANPTAAALTDSSGGSADQTVSAVGNTMSGDVSATINNNFAECADEINKLVADVADVKQLLNSVIDDLQALGLAA